MRWHLPLDAALASCNASWTRVDLQLTSSQPSIVNYQLLYQIYCLFFDLTGGIYLYSISLSLTLLITVTATHQLMSHCIDYFKMPDQHCWLLAYFTHVHICIPAYLHVGWYITRLQGWPSFCALLIYSFAPVLRT